MKTVKKHNIDLTVTLIDYIKMHTVRPTGTRKNQKKKNGVLKIA